jgi:hypothetical protein
LDPFGDAFLGPHVLLGDVPKGLRGRLASRGHIIRIIEKWLEIIFFDVRVVLKSGFAT